MEQNGLEQIIYDDAGHTTNPNIVTGATINVSCYADAIADALSR